MNRDQRIDRLRNACGCKESFFALLLALAAYFLLPQYFPHRATSIGTIAIGVGIAIAAAVIGKVTGLLIAQIRLQRLLRGSAVADRS